MKLGTRHLALLALLAPALTTLSCARSPAADPAPAPTPATQPPRADSARRDTTRPPAESFDRSTPPALGAPSPLSLPPVVERRLPNGLRLLVVEHRELPVADAILLVGTGGEGDPASRPGVANLTAAMLDEGTSARNALQIADQVAFLGIQLGTSSGWDVSSVSLHTPTAQLDSALALMAEVALRPSFPQQELERIRKERLTQLVQLRDRSPVIADRAYAAILYGAQHPYGRPLNGTEQSVKAISRADLQRFYRTYFRPNNATLIVVGDVTPDDIEQRVARLFGGWQRGAVPPVALREPPASGTTTVYLIDKPGAPQTSVRIGAVGVPRSTEDYFGIQLMNTILGGSFTSRLNQNLRETKGYTYGAGSGFSMRRAAGPFTARAEVTGSKTDSSLVEFMKELRAIRDTVPSAELEKAKRYLQLGLPADFETTRDIASQLVPIVVYGLPLDYYNSYVQQIERVTQADVQRVARKYVNPASLAVVIVGDRKSIEEPVRKLNLGELQLRDLTGMPLNAATQP